ncbi:MAG TPA: hypothetical protein ENJ56_08825 [Anaerolineae bacterium]|nr:hypothetical protein [Anaerolineae bacterium]
MTKHTTTTPAYALDTALLADILREGLENGEHPRLTIVSDSMTPLLKVGDQVVLEAVTADTLTSGEIVVMAEPHDMLTHRYWQHIEHDGTTYLITRGDRPTAYDPPHKPSALLGRVIARVRNGKTLPLNSGKGGTLNQTLAKIAAFENRHFANGEYPPTWDTLSNAEGRLLGQKWQASGRKWKLQTTYWLLKRYAQLLTLFLG